MTHRFDVAHGRDIVARWCALAEQRLEYLTELFETGRWRRYHSELEFLENIQEAKTAVETWRDLLTREASRNNSTVDMSWLDRPRTALPRVNLPRGQVHQLRPPRAPVAIEPPREVLVAKGPHQVCPDQVPSVPELEAPAVDLVLDPALGPALDPVLDPVLDQFTRELATIAERYPLLRNVM
jgi:uncharacterized repeat protein (TIGR03809 family)